MAFIIPYVLSNKNGMQTISEIIAQTHKSGHPYRILIENGFVPKTDDSHLKYCNEYHSMKSNVYFLYSIKNTLDIECIEDGILKIPSEVKTLLYRITINGYFDKMVKILKDAKLNFCDDLLKIIADYAQSIKLGLNEYCDAISIDFNRRGFLCIDSEQSEKYDYFKSTDIKTRFTFEEALSNSCTYNSFRNYMFFDEVYNQNTVYDRFTDEFKQINLFIRVLRMIDPVLKGDFKKGVIYSVCFKSYNFLDLFNAQWTFTS